MISYAGLFVTWIFGGLAIVFVHHAARSKWNTDSNRCAAAHFSEDLTRLYEPSFHRTVWSTDMSSRRLASSRHAYIRGRNSLFLLRVIALVLGAGFLQAAGAPPAKADDIQAKPTATADGKPYSQPSGPQTIPPRVLWGDAHLHTFNSFDAGMMGTRLTPDDAFRFARGDEVVSSTGVPAKLSRPLDFLVVTDHSDYQGLPIALRDGSPDLLANPVGKRWYDQFHSGGEGGFALFADFVKNIAGGQDLLNDPELAKTAWARSVAAAEKYNEPGRFSAIIGFEWSSTPDGNNLHRNVIFRDGGDKASQVLPLTTFASRDPEALWRYLADYEAKTGGQILAIPHNSNLSGGLMFADRTFSGKPIDRSYAEERAKWEPIVEATQTKGDSETDPSVSPEDDFANFERWDKANIMNNHLDTPEQQPFNYIRPTLTRGLKYEQTVGVNPFKFGLIGASDAHTGLSTADADNFFGVMPESEPGPNRISAPGRKISDTSKRPFTPVESVSGGMAAVWATENTRAAIFDAMRRREVYATTGPRITVRVFAGWDFKSSDLDRSDFAANGYAHGVPMGGDLSGAHKGQIPTLLIQAAKDPDGANLDRIQIIKGWLDPGGQTHEKIFDAAWSGKRKPDEKGKLPLVGNTVDIANATYSNSIGAPVLEAAWKDPHFDPAERAYYYIRVIEIPTPRWSTYDAKRFGVKLPDSVPATLTQRAYTSPIWYTPNSGA